MSKLFAEIDLKNKVSRNSFDLSESLKFTAKAGELLPVYHRTVLPGDKFRIKLGCFTRTNPINSAPFTQLKEYVDFFYVPYRLMWRNAPSVFTSNKENPVSASSPTASIAVSDKGAYLSSLGIYSAKNSLLRILDQKKNSFGYNRGKLAAKLLNHLGYPYITKVQYDKIIGGTFVSFNQINQQISAFPLLAYHKIYNDFYRNSRWEKAQPYLYNIDYSPNGAVYLPSNASDAYYDSPTLFDLHYANYPKDLLMGLLPNSQYGDPANITNDTGDASIIVKVNGNEVTLGSKGYQSKSATSFTSNADMIGYNFDTIGNQGDFVGIESDDFKKALNRSVSFLDIRNASFLQKYREIYGSGQLDYKNIVRKIFGYKTNSSLADTCLYLGGHSSTIQVQEQVNQNLATDQDYEPIIKGTGTDASHSDVIEFEAPEHGIIMAIYHSAPVVDYVSNGFHPDITKVAVDDYANPCFDKLGYQQVPANLFYINMDDNGVVYNPFLGYQLRYFDYKTGFDRTLGDFRETKKNWLAPIDTAYIKDYFSKRSDGKYSMQVDWSFFKVDPKVLDPIFYVNANSDVTSDQFLCSLNFDIQAVRNLDVNGLPY